MHNSWQRRTASAAPSAQKANHRTPRKRQSERLEDATERPLARYAHVACQARLVPAVPARFHSLGAGCMWSLCDSGPGISGVPPPLWPLSRRIDAGTPGASSICRWILLMLWSEREDYARPTRYSRSSVDAVRPFIRAQEDAEDAEPTEPPRPRNFRSLRAVARSGVSSNI